MSLKEQIKQALQDIKDITAAAEEVTTVMANGKASQQQVDATLQKGFKKLEEIEKRRGSIALH